MFEGSWDFYSGKKLFNVEGNMQLRHGSSQSVKLTPYFEFEMFFTTQSTGATTAPEDLHLYQDTTFGRENAFTLRNLRNEDFLPFVDTLERQCHEYLMIFETAEPFNLFGEAPWPPVNASGQLVTGFSNVYAIKVRDMYFPDITAAA